MRLAKFPQIAYHFRMRPGCIRVALPPVIVAAALAASGSGAAGPPRGNRDAVVREAAHAFHVPTKLLLAVGHLNTRWRLPTGPAMNGGYGPMDLTPAQLRRAGRIASIDPLRARHDLRENVRAGAALLAAAHTRSSWPAAVAALWGVPLADEVFHLRAPAAVAATQADYPGARWLRASRAVYSVSNRPISSRITTIVVHTTDGSYSGTLSWFRNPAARASAHYVIRSSDGEITQMVREKDEAWHSGNGAVNDASVGIEHEAWTTNCSWYTDAMYRSSAQLSAYLVTKYLIPPNRTHIIGHHEVPDPNHPGQFGGASHHTDPGPCWNWSKYMALIRDFAGSSVSSTLQRVADDSARGFARPRGWKRATSAGAYARSFVVSPPSSSGQPVKFPLKVPVAGRYALYAWWPAAASRNSSVPVGIDTANGLSWLRVDERTGGGWSYLGSFPLSTKASTVRFSPRTTTAGSIAADAVKVELLAPRATTSLDAASEGWAATARGLSATRDGGASWTAVSPPGVAPEQIRAVRIERARAWLVVATGSAKRPLSLYRTGARGATWTSTTLAVPRDVDVAAPAGVEVVDETNLYVALRLQPSRWGLSRGLLLRSSNGGTTWSNTPLPAGGDIAFATQVDGWLSGGLAHERLYATHNGGKSWKQVKPPAAITGAASTAYALPTFTSPTEGVLPVSLAAGTRSTLAFETTSDGGRSWKVAARVKLGKPLRIASRVATAVVDPSLWLAAVGTKLVAVTDAGVTKTTIGTLPGQVSALQFASATEGWAQVPANCAATAASCPLNLFATSDGGVTWSRLRPP